MRYSLTDDFMTMRSLSLMQTFPSPAKRQARRARFEREAEAISAERALQQASLLTQTARAWFERYYQEQIVGLLQRQREDANRVSDAVASAYRSGRSDQSDVLAAHAAVARLDDRLREARAELVNAQALLQRWVGEMAHQPLGPPPVILRTRLAAHQLAHQINSHPDIAVMNARERLALAEAELANQDKRADWSWSVMYSKRGNAFGDMVSIGVSLPLQWDQSHKQDRERAAKLELVEAVRLEREEMRRAHLFDVQRLLTSWQTNLTRLTDYDDSLIPLAMERVAAVEASFRGNKASLADVLEAQRMVSDTRLERLRIEMQTAALWAELEFLLPLDVTTQVDAPNSAHSLDQEQ